MVTVTFTGRPSGGVTAVIDRLEFTTKEAAGRGPKVTAVAPVNPFPTMVTAVPPKIEPLAGSNVLMIGAGTTSNSCARVVVTVPAGVVTVTSILPRGAAGDIAVMEVSELTTKGRGGGAEGDTRRPVEPITGNGDGRPTG